MSLIKNQSGDNRVIPVAISVINYISMHDDDDDEQSPLNLSLNSFHSFFSSLVFSLISFDDDDYDDYE